MSLVKDVYRVIAVHSHPIQYYGPFYKELSARAGIDLKVCFLSRQGVDEYWDEEFDERVAWNVPVLEGYEHEFVPNLSPVGSVGGFFSLVNPGIVAALRAQEPDALLIHGYSHVSELLALVWAGVSEVPVLFRGETHADYSHSGRLRQLLRQPVWALLRRVVFRFLYIGKKSRQYYRGRGIGEERLVFSPYGVDNDRFCRETKPDGSYGMQLRKQLDLPLDQPVVLYVSKLSPRKRPMDLLRAYAYVRQKGVQASLVVAGAGELEARARRFVEQQELSDVRFLGFVNQQELPDVYAGADVFVLPSREETWGLVVNEAMCAGLPVITTTGVGAAADLVEHEVNGFVYSPGDVEELTHRLAFMLGDQVARERMGRQSQKKVQAYDVSRAVDGVVSAVRSI